jgi:hypothetical protein
MHGSSINGICPWLFRAEESGKFVGVGILAPNNEARNWDSRRLASRANWPL